MGLLERWDQRNQRWADESMRDPDRRSGVGVIALLGVLYALATAIAVALEEWLVAAVSGVKAQAFLAIALVIRARVARRRRKGDEERLRASSTKPNADA